MQPLQLYLYLVFIWEPTYPARNLNPTFNYKLGRAVGFFFKYIKILGWKGPQKCKAIIIFDYTSAAPYNIFAMLLFLMSLLF